MHQYAQQFVCATQVIFARGSQFCVCYGLSVTNENWGNGSLSVQEAPWDGTVMACLSNQAWAFLLWPIASMEVCFTPESAVTLNMNKQLLLS